MKKCPYCAEEIQQEAIKCRWCQSWLVEEIPASAVTPPAAEEASAAAVETPPATATGPAPVETPTQSVQPTSQPGPPGEERVEFTHSGQRYLLGYGRDYFGIWDRQTPATPKYRFPRNDDGWRSAWQQYLQIETTWVEVTRGS